MEINFKYNDKSLYPWVEKRLIFFNRVVETSSRKTRSNLRERRSALSTKRARFFPSTSVPRVTIKHSVTVITSIRQLHARIFAVFYN